jgi:uncharacterized protein
LITSQVVITEVSRAVRKKADREPTFRLASGLMKAEAFLEELRLHPVEEAILRQAAAMVHPHLGSLDAIHVATALAVRPVAAFLTYDLRQAAAARMVGFAVRSPGA